MLIDNKKLLLKLIIFLFIISFLNLIFIKGEKNVVKKYHHFNDHSSSSLLDISKKENIPKEKIREIIKNNEFTLALIISNKNKFQIEVDYLPVLKPVVKFFFELKIKNNFPSQKVINIKIKTINGEEINVNPEKALELKQIYTSTNNKKLEIEFANHDKMIISNENIKELDPITNQNKQFSSYVKYIFNNDEFVLFNLREFIIYKKNMLKKEEITTISTLKDNNEDNKPFSNNPELFLLSDVHPTSSHINYYFFIIPTVIILVIGFSIFLWLKK